MISKLEFTSFITSLFKDKKVEVHNFDSGCVMIDIYINEVDMLVVQIEDNLIGVSLIREYINYIGISTTSDRVFASNQEAGNYLINLGVC